MITHSKYPCNKCYKNGACPYMGGCSKWSSWFAQMWSNLQRESKIIRELLK